MPVALVVLATLAPAAGAAPYTTLQRTIDDVDGDNLLDQAPGEDYTVVGAPEDFRPPKDGSILNFLQLSDFQMVDEESPGRVEFLDTTQRGLVNPFSAAYRPQESLTTQITEAMVRQARNTVSPITQAQLDLTILTGDNADSQQYNETRWFIDTLDGTTGAQNPDPEAEAEDTPRRDRKIDPDSGLHDRVDTCDLPSGLAYEDNDSVYDGVRGGGKFGYYEPESSDGDSDDGDGYSPRRDENERETGKDVALRDFPGLFERAQDRFEATGLDMPWYSAFGNHDALIQGNSPEAFVGPVGTSGEASSRALEEIATGCVKPSKLPSDSDLIDPQTGEPFGDLESAFREGTLDRETLDRFLLAMAADPTAALEDLAEEDPAPLVVPPDPRRCYLAKDDGPQPGGGASPPCDTGGWIPQHFRTSGTPEGHGFAPALAGGDQPEECREDPLSDACRGALLAAAEACEQDPSGPDCPPAVADARRGFGRPPEAMANHDGYYSFSPSRGLRFVVLDTITDECGLPVCSEGSVDDAQYRWLRRQIEEAAATEEYVLVFSHHTLRTTRFESSDRTEDPLHYGQRVDRKDNQPQNQTGGTTLEELYCHHPNVLAHAAGHEHENYVLPHDCTQAPTEEFPQPLSEEFYEVSTASHIDWSQQSRMIELVDNGDQTMSLVLTILDHDSPANPGGARNECSGCAGAGDQVLKLGSIGRELAYNDYQAGEFSSGRGDRSDRNVIIHLDRPPPPDS